MAKKSSRNRRTQAKKQPRRVDTSPKFRVWKLDRDLRAAVTTKRESRHQTIREFVANSIREELPALVAELANQGIRINDEQSTTSVRIQMEVSTLDALRDASRASGLDQSQLFTACLRMATRRKRRRATACRK